MKTWAIADLHLGLSTGKWMDKFGDQWKGHHEKIRSAWLESIAAGDLVLLPGDFSWAMRPAEVEVDLLWLAELPGTKVMIKGNHDYWWPGSYAKLDQLLPPGVHAIKKRAIVANGVPIIGVRGGDFFPRESGTPESVEKRLRRERHELLMSIEHLRSIYSGSVRPIAMFHYPPFPLGRSESLFTRMIEDTGCEVCVFGHLHTPAEWSRVFQGEKRGVRYRLVACDALGFKPLLIAGG